MRHWICTNPASCQLMSDKIAVCIPTLNRPNMLYACLAETGKIVCPDKYEIIVIVADNDASATARKICDRVSPSYSYPLHYVVEPERGLSSIRNRLLKEALSLNADWIAFIDDDEIPEPNWLVKFTEAIAEYAPDVLSGPLVQFNEGEDRPSVNKLQIKRTTGSTPRHIATNNVMFKARLVSEQNLTFDPFYNFIGGEDFDFFSRSLSLGNRHVWIAEAIVYETVPPERMTKRYLFHRHFTGGINAVLRYKKLHNVLLSWARYLPKIFGKLFGSLIYLFGGILFPGSNYLKKSIKAFASACGYVAGLLNIIVERYGKIDGN